MTNSEVATYKSLSVFQPEGGENSELLKDHQLDNEFTSKPAAKR